MRTLALSLAAASLLALGATAFITRSPQHGADPAAMAEMMRLAQPGPEHEELARYAGEWDVEIAVSMAPGTAPMKATAKAVATPILGKRFLELDTEGSMMGLPTQSKVFIGFDRRHARWTSVGFDTMGTYWVSGQGVREADGKLRLRGEDLDPAGKQVYYNEIDFAGPDVFSFAVCFTELGGTKFDPPHRMAELRYTRRK